MFIWYMHCQFGQQLLRLTLSKLKRLQNKAKRIITKTSSKDKISQHYCRLQVLKLHYLYKFEVAKLMHQFIHKRLLDMICQCFWYFNDIFKYLLRNSVNYSLYFPQFFSNKTQRSNQYVGVKYGTTSLVSLNNFPTLNLDFYSDNFYTNLVEKYTNNIYICKE